MAKSPWFIETKDAYFAIRVAQEFFGDPLLSIQYYPGTYQKFSSLLQHYMNHIEKALKDVTISKVIATQLHKIWATLFFTRAAIWTQFPVPYENKIITFIKTYGGITPNIGISKNWGVRFGKYFQILQAVGDKYEKEAYKNYPINFDASMKIVKRVENMFKRWGEKYKPLITDQTIINKAQNNMVKLLKHLPKIAIVKAQQVKEMFNEGVAPMQAITFVSSDTKEQKIIQDLLDKVKKLEDQAKDMLNLKQEIDLEFDDYDWMQDTTLPSWWSE